jgi:tail-anchored protein insertion receptor
LYTRIFVTGLYNEQNQLKSSIVQTRTELNKTSAQEEFAKWAKLRRRLDKALADLEKLS